MFDSFNKWEADDREERENAGFKELQSLTNLTCLEIEIEDPTLVAENKHITTKLDRFCIEFGTSDDLPPEFHQNLVRFDFLPNLDTFCQGIEGIEFPLLTEIYIKKCPKMNSMVSCNGILERKENKVGGGSSNEYSSHFFCQLQKASFNNLKYLTIDRNPFCVHEIPASSFLSLLEELTISGYRRSGILLSSSIAKNLVHLTRLTIEECDEIVQVVKDDDEEESEANANLFPKLEYLQLMSLPKLVSFCELKCDVVLPTLRQAAVNSCPGMKNWSLGFLAAPNLEEFITDLDHHLELGVNVSFDRLKGLTIKRVGNVEYPLYHHNSFTPLVVYGLEALELYGVGSMSSFPYSVVGKLVNLRLLAITECCEMVKVIEEEDEVVVSGNRSTLLFPKLEELWLYDLLILERFCERKCVVKLPSLRRVSVFRCPAMKSFSLGPLTAPDLKFIKIDDDEYIGIEKDLNREVQQHYLARSKEEEEEEEGHQS